ncbi:MAG: histidine phosphatase family protein [Cyclobacteriaceae bacterium]
MKTLYLVRHAKSDWGDVSLKDFDRPLNARGYGDAPAMGKYLKSKEEVPEFIVASPSLRTTSTAHILSEQLGKDAQQIHFNDSIYEASVRELLNAVNALDDQYNSVMLIGHNPASTYLAEYLTNEEIGNMPTCSVVKIVFDLKRWEEISQNTGSSEFFITPKTLEESA